MINNTIRDTLSNVCPEATIFDNPSFDNSIIGISVDDRIVYDFEKMIEELMTDDNIDYLEAQEFIEYNTIRALPYCENPPIIFYNLEDVG